MQAKPLATNLGEQANKIAVSVQSGDGDVLALWGMCRRYAMQQATRWLRAFESSGGVEDPTLIPQTTNAAKYKGISPCMARACKTPTAAEEL